MHSVGYNKYIGDSELPVYSAGYLDTIVSDLFLPVSWFEFITGKNIVSVEISSGLCQYRQKGWNTRVNPQSGIIEDPHNEITNPEICSSSSVFKYDIVRFRFLWPCIVSEVWRERENQQDATIRCLLLTFVSTCFGHHYAHLQENKDRVTAYSVLLWFCWMWLVAVVRHCLVGCEHCEGFSVQRLLNRNLHSTRNLQRSASQPLPTTSNKIRPIYTRCSNRAFVLLKMGIMMAETCWDRS